MSLGGPESSITSARYVDIRENQTTQNSKAEKSQEPIPEAKCLVLDRESFNLLLGPLKDIIEAAREGRQRPERHAAPEIQGCYLVEMFRGPKSHKFVAFSAQPPQLGHLMSTAKHM